MVNKKGAKSLRSEERVELFVEGWVFADNHLVDGAVGIDDDFCRIAFYGIFLWRGVILFALHVNPRQFVLCFHFASVSLRSMPSISNLPLYFS